MMKIKQAEIRAWLDGAEREQTRLLSDADNDSMNNILSRLRVLEAMQSAMAGDMSGLQALAGAGVQQGLKGV